jgi:hypothetical protein
VPFGGPGFEFINRANLAEERCRTSPQIGMTIAQREDSHRQHALLRQRHRAAFR